MLALSCPARSTFCGLQLPVHCARYQSVDAVLCLLLLSMHACMHACFRGQRASGPSVLTAARPLAHHACTGRQAMRAAYRTV